MGMQHVLIIKTLSKVFGPYNTSNDAEYAASDYFGTGVTGASIRGDFEILPLFSEAELTKYTKIVLGNLTDEQASAVLAPGVIKNGGGWTPMPNDREGYACCGAHKDGTSGWKVTEIRDVW